MHSPVTMRRRRKRNGGDRGEGDSWYRRRRALDGGGVWRERAVQAREESRDGQSRPASVGRARRPGKNGLWGAQIRIVIGCQTCRTGSPWEFSARTSSAGKRPGSPRGKRLPNKPFKRNMDVLLAAHVVVAFGAQTIYMRDYGSS